MSDNLTNHFREAWLALAGNDFASQLARESLEASTIGIPALERALFELRNAHQAQLELKLTGPSVVGHSTTAEKFADFVRGIADAVRAIQKASMGRQRLRSTLLISGPLPGSVRVVLTAAPPVAKHEQIDATATETAESDALVETARLLERAEADSDEPDATVLQGMTAALPAKARTALLRVAESVSAAEWTVAGELRRAGRDVEALKLGAGGARRLITTLKERVEETYVFERDGEIDGQRRSLGAMWFIPDGDPPMEAAVLDPKLFDAVADLAARGARAHVHLKATVVHPPSTAASVRRSYTLLSIRELAGKATPLELQT